MLRHLLSVLAIVSTISIPIAALVDGSAMAGAIMSQMPDDMPCCAGNQAAAPECQKACPLLTVCVAKCFPGAPDFAAFAFTPQATGEPVRPGDDVITNPLGAQPPARPPKS